MAQPRLLLLTRPFVLFSYHRAMPEPPPTTLLEDAIDIPIWLEADASKPLRERTRRDREIALRLDTDSDAVRIRRWWGQIGNRGDALPGRGLVRARKWVNLALALLGCAGGVGLALAAFAYDGTHPVNVVRLLALLVAPQLILIAFSLLLIPGSIPGLRAVQDALSAINPGALAAAVCRQMTKRPQARAFDWISTPTTAQRRFGKWQMLHWSQITAVAFNLAVIATAVVLIAFTDLAFGWSTTVDISSEAASRIFSAIAAPWAAIFPEAVPDQALVERSQFFRLDSQSGLPDSRILAGWWSFTVLAVIVYGLIPRCVFLVISGARLRSATRAVLLNDSRVVALLDRMSTPEVESRGRLHGDEQPETPFPASGVPHAELRGSASAVIWSQAIASERTAEFARRRLGLALDNVVEAGAGTLDADFETLKKLVNGSNPVVVLTPAWEPPLLEFNDFLGALRRTIGPTRSIVVVPVGEALQESTASERNNWSIAVAKANDVHAYVEAAEE